MDMSVSDKRRETMDEQQFFTKLDRIKDIPTLPTIVFELNKLLRDPDTSIKTVCDTIEKDQAITLKILKLVNSAFYGFKSKISDLRNAVALLGYNAVRNAIVSLSVINSFPKDVALMDFDITLFWKPSLAVAAKKLPNFPKKNLPTIVLSAVCCTIPGKSSWHNISPNFLRPFGRPCKMNRYLFIRQSAKRCLLIIPKSVHIWRVNGNCQKVWWMQFAGIMSFSLNSKAQIL